ncbi:pinin/SDK/memA/ protein conserved region-domain-containing protein [Colletotrichum cereale]|nr:pinin/SDK/memA/ protein conserved region-domain-containing protein [Colletotrichum cereale]
MATVTEAPVNAIQAEPTSSEVEVAQKRKASIDSDGDEGLSKRPRIEEGDHRDPPAQDPSTTEPRPRNGDAGANTTRRTPLSKDEEKKRGKRLFGGLLSTLSQTNSGSQHKKRREIEQRQHERAQKQRAEDEKRRTEKLARITEARWQEQIKFDEKAMKSRHASMVAMAHSLRTKAVPPIYYRPWKFTKEQEDEIDDQIQNAMATVARETEAFRERKDEHERRYGQSRPPTGDDVPPPANMDDLAKSHSEPLVEAAPEAPAVANDVPSPSHQHDEPGDVVEDAEDMVIY